MGLDKVTGRIAARVDDLRDLTAGAVSADDSPSFRELGRVRRRVDEVEQRLADRLDEMAHDNAMHWNTLESRASRTSWPRRMFWLTLGAAAGAAASLLADPDMGRTRRARLSDQVAARGRDLRDQASTSVEMAANRTKGALIEKAKDVLPQDVPDDPHVLRQRIQSQVLGYRDDVADVVLRVDGPGEVALKGTVPSSESERELVAAVSGVDGVMAVRSELDIRD